MDESTERHDDNIRVALIDELVDAYGSKFWGPFDPIAILKEFRDRYPDSPSKRWPATPTKSST